jgi:hypothetical protein
VAGDDRGADRGHDPDREPHHQREQDQAPANHPDDAGQDVIGEIEVERPGDADHRQFEQHEQEPSRQQVRIQALLQSRRGVRLQADLRSG